MLRSVPFRRTVSDAVSWRQDQAMNATIYILREMGPTGFLLKEEGETKKFKVYLGDPHTCTCPVHKKERDLCKHICWVLLKKFRIPREDSESFQLGLVEREINALLRGRTQQEARQKRNVARTSNQEGGSSVIASNGREVLPQREITEEDVCPICQDEFLAEREPVTYCRFGCAKSIHIKCMKVWAEHQQSTGETTIKCPLCREDFGEIEFLQKEYRNSSLQKTQAERGTIHRGVVCSQCNQSPIAGRCYRCMECRDKYLCQECFSSNFHSQHEFQFRQKPNQRWRPAQRSSGGALPAAVLEDMQNRELQEEDYELLLQLDSKDANRTSTIPEDVVKSFATEKVREGGALTSPGVQCRVCLRGFTAGQVARRLPCRHKFHRDCIDGWLLHQHPTCPVDGTVVWNPLTANLTSRAKEKKKKGKTDDEVVAGQDVNQNQRIDLSGLGITGVGAKMNDGTPTRRRGTSKSTVGQGSQEQSEVLSAGFQLMGLGFSNQRSSSWRETESSPQRGGQLRQGKLRAPAQSQRTPDSINMLFTRPAVSIPSEDSAGQGLSLNSFIVSRNNDVTDEVGAVANYVNEDPQNCLTDDSRASWLSSGEASKNVHNANGQNITAPSNTTPVDVHSSRSEPKHKPPSGGSRGRNPRTCEHRSTSGSKSVPNDHRDGSYGLTTSRLTSSNSAPSTLKRMQNSQTRNGNSERGRRPERPQGPPSRRRARSTSSSRESVVSRLHPSQAEKLHTIETLFLGSPQGKLMTEGSQGQSSRQGQLVRGQPRASSLPRETEGSSGLDIKLSGYRVGLE